MTNPDKDLLTTTEGVDEGSAASTAEGGPAGGGPAGQAEAAGLGSATDATDAPDADRPGHAHGDAESQPAPPSEVDSAESRQARESGTGQQLEAGEG
ncbi:MAG: hypothetical protein ACR2K2_14615 [Mycobacteriales bacterium]